MYQLRDILVVRAGGRAVDRAGGLQGRQAQLTLSRPYFFSDHFQTCKDIHYPKISDELDYGGSISFNMRIIQS